MTTLAAQPTAAEVELQRSRDLLAKVWSDPNLRSGVRKHIKELFPDRHLPDDDFDAVAAPLKAENADLKKRFDDLEALLKKRDDDAEKARKDRDDARFGDQLQEARKKFSLTDEGFKQMVDRMTETKAYDPMAAAAYVVSQAPPTLPPGPLYGTNALNFAATEGSEIERYKMLHQGLDGPAKYLEAEIRDCFGPNGKDYVAREMGKQYADMAFAQ